MANKLPFSIAILLLSMAIINNQSSSSARNLGNTTPSHHHHLHHKLLKVTFIIKDVLIVNVTKSKPATTKFTSQLPFPKPLGLFPPIGGIPISESGNPSVSVPGVLSTQTLDSSSGIGLLFPARATLQELEFGTLIAIDEDLLGSSGYGEVIGKAQGMFVASSEDGTSHMMAVSASFANSEFKDGLRFFGVHRKDGAESHIAVIGGTGKYDGANGYATVKAVAAGQEHESNKFLLFNVYLS